MGPLCYGLIPRFLSGIKRNFQCHPEEHRQVRLEGHPHSTIGSFFCLAPKLSNNALYKALSLLS